MFRQFVEAQMAPRGQLQRWLEQVCRQHAWSPSRQLKDQSQELVAVCSSMRVCVKERLCLCGNLCDYNLGKKIQKLPFLEYCDIFIQVES